MNSIIQKTAAFLAASFILTGIPFAYSAEASAETKGNVVKVNFVRPSYWSGRSKFVDGGKQKYLQLVGDPEQKNNRFYYAFYYMPKMNLQGGDEITFKVSCKLEKQTAGKFQVGIYEFSDPKAMKSIRFQSVDVPVSSDWQTLTKTVTLHPNTRATRFYFLGRNAGKGDTLLVRGLEFELHSK